MQVRFFTDDRGHFYSVTIIDEDLAKGRHFGPCGWKYQEVNAREDGGIPDQYANWPVCEANLLTHGNPERAVAFVKVRSQDGIYRYSD